MPATGTALHHKGEIPFQGQSPFPAQVTAGLHSQRGDRKYGATHGMTHQATCTRESQPPFKKIPRSCLQRHLALSQARPIRGSSQYSTCWEGSSLSLLIHLSCLQMPQSCEWPLWSLRDRRCDPSTKQLFPLRLAMFPLPGHPKPVAYFNPWILLSILVWTHSTHSS